MNARRLLLPLVLAVAIVFVPAQDQGNEQGEDWIELESARDGRSPQEKTEIHVLHTRARSGDRSMQLAALGRIARLVEQNDPVSRYPEVTEILTLLALGPKRTRKAPGTEGVPPGGVSEEVRIEAVELLGAVGGPQAYEVVVSILQDPDSPTVTRVALASLPRMGVRPDARLTSVLAGVAARSYGDDAVARAVVNATSRLHERYGFMDEPVLFEAVMDIAQGPYSRRLRTEAFELIEMLRD